MAGMGRQERTLAPIPTPNSTSTMIPMDPPPALCRSHHHHHHFNPSPATSSGGGGGERVNPQWGHQETAELISIRGELERDFSTSKRNKALWETVGSRMRERGFCRTPEQCKCKWKNLVNRYKGKETSDTDNGRQCPFFEELQAVFSERAKNMQRSLMQSEQVVAVQSRKRMTSSSGDQFSEDFSQDEDDEGDDSNEETLAQGSNALQRKSKRKRHMQQPINANSSDISSSRSIQEMLKAFFQQQQRIEMQWRESMERHRHERELFEQEWRQSMEKLERERLVMEQAWREREEQRKMREEIRAEKRDALLTILLNNLISPDRL